MSLPNRLMGLCALLLVVGCATPADRARTLVRQGQYTPALRMYDALVEEKPEDAGLRAQRDEARRAALVERTRRSASLRQQGNLPGALEVLREALASRDAWTASLDAPTRQLLDQEVQAQADGLRQDIHAALASGGPLRAERALSAREETLRIPDLAALGPELSEAIQGRGRDACAQLQRDAGLQGPYGAWWVGRYCAHWQVTLAPAPLPGLLRELAVDGGVEGASPAPLARLVEVFRSSPWYSASAQDVAHARLSGRYAAKLAREQITVQHNYSVMVPYTDRQSYQDPEQVPYQATEHYSVQVPYSASESYTYSCGSNRSCTGHRTVTRYRSESRTRYVTRYRTEYRTKWRNVTRHRPEARSYSHPADRLTADYAATALLTVVLPPQDAPLRVEATETLQRTELEHSESNPAVNLQPHPSTLPEGPVWLQGVYGELEQRLRTALEQRWLEAHCQQARYTLEEAARCVYGAPGAPAAVADTLGTALGEDRTHLDALRGH